MSEEAIQRMRRQAIDAALRRMKEMETSITLVLQHTTNREEAPGQGHVSTAVFPSATIIDGEVRITLSGGAHLVHKVLVHLQELGELK